MENEITEQNKQALLNKLKVRFDKNISRNKDLEWSNLLGKLEANPGKLWSLNEMEMTGGEPDLVNYDAKTNTYIFMDCSKESPKGRRSFCYDRKALESRKTHKPKDNAVDFAARMGITILTEEQYRNLQELGDFDTKTSSWVLTPKEIRALGGALFSDYRYGQVFTYHNGAESYYAARGFRGMLKI